MNGLDSYTAWLRDLKKGDWVFIKHGIRMYYRRKVREVTDEHVILSDGFKFSLTDGTNGSLKLVKGNPLKLSKRTGKVKEMEPNRRKPINENRLKYFAKIL